MFPLRDNVPTRTFPAVTVGLILANTIVWLWQIGGRTTAEQDIVHYGYYPCKIDGPCVGPARLAELDWYENAFTSMFMHGGWSHIIGNMLFLWIFGNNVEDALGKVRFLLWYVAAGLAATALQTFVTLNYGNAADASIPNIGASGAIAGVLGAYFLLLPHARVLTAIFLVVIFLLRELPAALFLGIYFPLQAWEANFQLEHPPEGGGTAVFAHIGGIVFGLLLVKLLARRRPLPPRY